MTVLVLLLAGCGGDDDTAAPDETTTTTTSTSTTSTTEATTTTQAPEPGPECDLDAVLTAVDETLEMVRLAPGGEWTLATDESVFAERTVTVDEYLERLALDCGALAVQTTDDGGERLALVAWTGPRITFVVQATDAPSAPYERSAMFDVVVEWVRGEYFEGPYRPNRDDRTTWATTLEGGESFVVHARDYPAGPVAKDWVAGLEFGEPEEYVSLPSERFGIDALRAVGARNVDVAELPETGSEIGYLSFVTPLGMAGETRVAPLGWIDPTTEWHGRPVSTETIAGVEVHVSEAGPPDDSDILTYDIAHFTFECGDHVWHVITGFGSTGELRDFVTTLILSLDC